MTVNAGGKKRSGSSARSRSEDEWLTVEDVCRTIKISRRTFERYLSGGTGPRVKRTAGRRGPIRIRRDWLDEWMEEGAA
jgi:excisionase family DNA binding protein